MHVVHAGWSVPVGPCRLVRAGWSVPVSPCWLVRAWPGAAAARRHSGGGLTAPPPPPDTPYLQSCITPFFTDITLLEIRSDISEISFL